MKKVKEFLGKLFHSDTFLKVLAVLMAVGFWFYIVTFADTDSTKTYQDIPVTFAYEGTVPYNNGLMPLVTSRSYNVAVEGQLHRRFSPDALVVNLKKMLIKKKDDKKRDFLSNLWKGKDLK